MLKYGSSLKNILHPKIPFMFTGLYLSLRGGQNPKAISLNEIDVLAVKVASKISENILIIHLNDAVGDVSVIEAGRKLRSLKTDVTVFTVAVEPVIFSTMTLGQLKKLAAEHNIRNMWVMSGSTHILHLLTALSPGTIADLGKISPVRDAQLVTIDLESDVTSKE